MEYSRTHFHKKSNNKQIEQQAKRTTQCLLVHKVDDSIYYFFSSSTNMSTMQRRRQNQKSLCCSGAGTSPSSLVHDPKLVVFINETAKDLNSARRREFNEGTEIENKCAGHVSTLGG
jgi:hypothetical protein